MTHIIWHARLAAGVPRSTWRASQPRSPSRSPAMSGSREGARRDEHQRTHRVGLLVGQGGSDRAAERVPHQHQLLSFGLLQQPFEGRDVVGERERGANAPGLAKAEQVGHQHAVAAGGQLLGDGPLDRRRGAETVQRDDLGWAVAEAQMRQRLRHRRLLR